MLILMSGIERIPADIYEAATIDGASKPAQFRCITLPLLRSVIKNCIVFWTVGVVGFFVWSQMWSAPLPSELTTITPFVYMYNITFGTTGNADRNAAMGAAVGVLMAVTVLFVFFAVNRLIKDEDVEF
jgi:multiple sugar transport system permease protein